MRALDAAESAVRAGERDAGRLLDGVRRELAKSPRAEIDYAELRDPHSLQPTPDRLDGPALLALAVFLRPPEGGAGTSVRLIDNRVLPALPRSEEAPR